MNRSIITSSVLTLLLCFPAIASRHFAPSVRVDVRDSFGSRIAYGMEQMGTPDGGEPEFIDTTAMPDGWNDVERDGITTRICVRNGIRVLGGRMEEGLTETIIASTNIVRDNVLVPSNSVLRCEYGTILKFTEDASIISERGGRVVLRGVACADVADDSIGGDSDCDNLTPTNFYGQTGILIYGSLACLSFYDNGQEVFPSLLWTAGLTGDDALYGSLPEPTPRHGYSFEWVTSEAGGESVSSASIIRSGDTTLYAKWTGNTYTVTLNRQNGTGGSSFVTATYGSAMPAITVPTRTGYAFGGYYTAANGGGTQYYTAAGASTRSWDKTSATTLYAYWTQDVVPLPVHRFYSPNYKGHFFTISAEEAESIRRTNARNWNYEGVAYKAFTEQAPGTVALYRFYSKSYRGHFFTTDDEERDGIIAGNPNWKYEGIAYYVYPDAASERVPVFRFYSKRYRHHFYTIDEDEKNNLIATNPNWKYEGIAFYALPADDTGRSAKGVVRAAATGMAAGAAGAEGEGVGVGERTGETGDAAAPWTLTLRHPCPGRVLAVPDVAYLGDIVVETGDEMSACLAILATGANADVSATADAAELRLALPDGVFTAQLWDGAGTLLDEQEAEGVFDFAILANGAWHRLAIFDADGKEVFAIWLRAE